MANTSNIQVVKEMAELATFFIRDGVWYRIDSTEPDYINCHSEDTLCEFEFPYNEVDLEKDKFKKLVDMQVPK